MTASYLPISVRGPYIVGDAVKIKKTKKFGVVAGFNSGVLVRVRNGQMVQIAHTLLEFNYGRRGG